MLACATRVAVRLANGTPVAVEIEAHGAPERAQHLEIRSGAAAAIEDARRWHAGHGARERRLHVLPEATKPEVRLLRSIRQLK